MRRPRLIVLGLCAFALVLALFAVAAQAKNPHRHGKKPSSGFVTGGGWIASPGGALHTEPVLQRVWEQGFETDADGWFDADSDRYGSVERVTSGTDGVASATGGWHALLGGDADSAPSSRFDGYRSAWSGAWTASIKVYLDTDWLAGYGFDYSVAANGTDGQHQRDFIFHVAKDTSTGKLLVAASNNTNFAPREDLETIHNLEVTESGWYTLRHTFRDAGGVLAVDLQVLDAGGILLFTETRSDPSDLIPSVVGGNRYAWFTCISGMTLAVDDHWLDFPVKADPTGKATFGFVSKYRKGATVPTGNTRFKFRAGGLSFKSTAYTSLAVSGATAEYAGLGTINGAGDYRFVLTAHDGPSKTDTFRIQIFDRTDDSVIYDNGSDQSLGGGSIVIHKAK